MSQQLTIFAPNVGLKSETFIRRHATDLAPGRTAVLSTKVIKPAAWSVDCPLLVMATSGRLVRRVKKVVSLGLAKPANRIKHAKKVIEFLTIHKASVLLGEYLHDSWPLLPIAREAGVRFFVHAHGYDLSRIFRHEAWRERYRDYAAADGVIVVNSLMRQRMESLGIPAEKIHYIPYGIDVPAAPVTRSDSGVMRCLAVGRMVGKKAPLSLLEAFSCAVAEDPRIHLDYVGEGPLYEAATAFVSSCGLGDHVTFHGGQGHDAVMKLMKQADCFVQHSVVDPENGDEEGLPVAILEAMSMALPVVSTRHAGIPDAVRHGHNGLLVEEGDVAGMAEHLVDLSQDAAVRRAMGQAGWERARSEFSWTRERDSLRELLGL